ncbi:type II toxin-antitoxin system RelE/ParE family toxin [Waterburya agarophytonicola K14]|uniref:Type II toxin-antitoxin system RelE/ParE family toxin n=1 Tax=Waterburya agarophytonicola KI4 TaxID=2874699 RepID=A0A964BXZ9_9CYAN|nr:type II toxin-antitoxin system RelE/ParE family toxin [Waterburya agarophytonicola]MCC0179918.1 type II toxin-antitoxin system RelE/ParE family toxin [Waterburya agarophytonicola KI4]
MEAQEKTILIYVKRDGKIPFTDWLESLRDRKSRAIIRTRINRIRLGNLGDCKTVGGGVSELRINFAGGYRVYFAQQGNTMIILLCGGDKSSQRKDIEQAKLYWQDYQERGDD